MAQETTGSDATAGTESGMPTPPAAKEMTRADRDELASQLVDRLALWSGAAGLIPVGLVDFLAVGGVQLYMLRRLSEIGDLAGHANHAAWLAFGLSSRASSACSTTA